MAGIRSKLALVVVAASLVLTGCLSADQKITVETDGSGVYAIDLVLSPELVSVFSAFGGEEITSEALVKEFEQDPSGLPEGIDVTFEPLEDVEGAGVRVVFAFDDLDELNTLLAPSEDSETTSAITGGVTRTGDRFEFRAQAVPQEDLAGDFGFGSQDLGSGLPEPSAKLSIKLPGGVVETNGNEEDGFATWDLLADDLPRELVLVTDLTVATGGFPWPLAIGGVLLVLAAGAGVAMLLLRRRGHPAPGPTTAPPAGPGGWAPQAPAAPTPAPAAWAPQPEPQVPADPTAWAPQPEPQVPADPTAWVPQPEPQVPAAPAAWAPQPEPQVPAEPAAWTPQPEPQAPAAWTPQPEPQSPAEAAPAAWTPQPAEPVAQPAAEELPPAGWYPDPADPTRTRWWTGRQWSA